MKQNICHFVNTLAGAVILTLVTTSCSALVPVTRIETGPTQTAAIEIPLPVDPAGSAALELEFLTGSLTLSPGAEGALVTGDAAYNAPALAPDLAVSGGTRTLSTGDQEIEGIPRFEDELVNTWDLKLAGEPMSLKIHAGPYTGAFELGGLALERLEIDEMGSNLTAAFSRPNAASMSALVLNTGGSNMTFTGLANANFAEMKFNAGAGTYTLGFDGELRRDASVNIDCGASTVNIVVPGGVSARLIFEGGLTTVEAGDGWQQSENVYTHPGTGPTLDFLVKMGVGTLNLKSS